MCGVWLHPGTAHCGGLPWAFGLSALTAMLLAAAGAAQAAILVTSASNYGVIYNISGSSTAGGTNDYAIAASESFNVAVGNVLVVEFDQCDQFNNALEANPTIKWVTSAGTQSLGTPLIEQTGAGSAFPYAEIYYLPTPNTAPATW